MRVRGAAFVLPAAFAVVACDGVEGDVLMSLPSGDDASALDASMDASSEGAVDTTPSEGGFDVPATTDVDHDGYVLEDDCDDGNPLINPGAIEVPGDKVDNDCNGKTDEPLVDCDVGFPLATTDPMDLARSIGLCQTTTATATGKARTWGVISAAIQTSDGIGAPLPRQYGVEPAWGTTIVPRAGKSLVVLSSGVARTPAQPGYVDLPKGTDSTTNANKPPTGWPRNTKGCPVTSVPYAFDSVALKLKVRVPTNAKSFTYDLDFYTTEYVEYACQAYNDSYVALLKTKSPLDPAAAGNISYTAEGDPINVNSVFFESCYPDSWLGRSYTCPRGVAELLGTGYDAIDKTFSNPARNGCTGWLTTTQAIVPGEDIEITFLIWNTADHWLPSAVLIDDWQWSADPTTSTVTTRPK
jgi:hypothetical protein